MGAIRGMLEKCEHCLYSLRYLGIIFNVEENKIAIVVVTKSESLYVMDDFVRHLGFASKHIQGGGTLGEDKDEIRLITN